MSKASGSKLATAYYELIPSMAGAETQITEQLVPASKKAGDKGGSSLGSSLLGGLGRFAAPLAALATGISVAGIVRSSTAAFEGLVASSNSLQRVAGGTKEQVSGLVGAMQLSGVSSDKVAGSLTIFSKNLGNATGDAAKTQAMTAKLGLSFLDASGQVKPMSDILPGLADRFKSMPDGAEKTALAISLFGRSGAQLLPFLNKGSAGIADLTAQASKMGIVVTDVSGKIFADARASTRNFQTATQGLMVSLGGDLLPVLDSVQNVFRNAMIPVIQAATGFLTHHQGAFLAAGNVIAHFGEMLSSKVVSGLSAASKAMGELISGFKNGTDAVGTNQSKFAAFGAAIYGVFDSIHRAMAPVFAALGPLFAQLGPVFANLAPQLLGVMTQLSPMRLIFTALAPVLPQIVQLIGTLAATLGGALGTALSAILPAVTTVAGILSKGLMGVISTLLPVIVTLATTLGGTLAKTIVTLAPVIASIATTLGKVLGSALTTVMPLVTTLAGFIGKLLSAVLPLIAPLLGLLTPILGLIAPLLSLIGPILGPLISLFMALLKPILDLVTPLVTLLVPVLSFIVTILAAVIKGIVDVITWLINFSLGSKTATKQAVDVFRAVESFFRDMWTNIIGFFAKGIDGIIGFFTGLPGKIMGALSSAGQWLVDIGKNMIQGLLDGAGSLLRNIGSFFLKILPSWIVDPFKAALGIHSPSTVFTAHGQNIAQGLINGITGMQGDIDSTLSNLVATPSLSITARAAAASSAASASSSQNQLSLVGAVFELTVDGDPVKAVVTRQLAAASQDRKTDLSTGKQTLAF